MRVTKTVGFMGATFVVTGDFTQATPDAPAEFKLDKILSAEITDADEFAKRSCVVLFDYEITLHRLSGAVRRLCEALKLSKQQAGLVWHRMRDVLEYEQEERVVRLSSYLSDEIRRDMDK